MISSISHSGPPYKIVNNYGIETAPTRAEMMGFSRNYPEQ